MSTLWEKARRKEVEAELQFHRSCRQRIDALELALRNVHALVRRMRRAEITGGFDHLERFRVEDHLERFCVEAMPELRGIPTDTYNPIDPESGIADAGGIDA